MHRQRPWPSVPAYRMSRFVSYEKQVTWEFGLSQFVPMLVHADFGSQPDAASYRQMGNGVNVGAAYYVFRQHVMQDKDDIADLAPGIVDAVLGADPNPDVELEAHAAERDVRFAASA